jgi:hypothetical protein
VSARAFDRWRLTLPLLLPSLGGLCYLYAFGAPARLIAVNAGALVLALAWILLCRMPANAKARLGMAAVLSLALFMPLLTGPSLGGVARWLPAGPVMLQSGPLLLPLLVVLAAGNARTAPAVLALTTAALSLQPDAASLLALAMASTVLAVLSRSLACGLVALAAAVLAVVTSGAGGLEPQLYTEGVLAHVAERSLAAAIALGLMLFLAPFWHLVIAPRVSQAEGIALATLLVGFATMAMVAPFPFPLIGYGASPILGFGLALGALSTKSRTGFLAARQAARP